MQNAQYVFEIMSMKNRRLLNEYEKAIEDKHRGSISLYKKFDLESEILKRMDKHDCESMAEFMDH